jgi:hypothetical protein
MAPFRDSLQIRTLIFYSTDLPFCIKEHCIRFTLYLSFEYRTERYTSQRLVLDR